MTVRLPTATMGTEEIVKFIDGGEGADGQRPSSHHSIQNRLSNKHISVPYSSDPRTLDENDGIRDLLAKSIGSDEDYHLITGHTKGTYDS